MASCYSPIMLILLLQLMLFSFSSASFNYEVERRVFERVNDFMSGPMIVTSLLERFRKNGAFPNQLNVSDRDAYATLSYSLLNEYEFDMIYYGTEDGMFVGYNEAVWGTYREPVNSGYFITDPDMQKYYRACVNRETGVPENCTMEPNADYIQCINNCNLALCQGEDEDACTDIGDGSTIACQRQQKWCPQYDIVQTEDGGAVRRGYVPRTQHCHTPTGVFSQEPGEILQDDRVSLGNCLYEDERTLVERTLAGDYIYCQGQICDNVFVGGFRSRDYDPRFRGWYITTKQIQRPNWSPPYPFFSNLDLGITFSAPYYIEDDNQRQVFRGVFAVDYSFEHINKFLVDSYGLNRNGTAIIGQQEEGEQGPTLRANNDQTYVVIYEATDSHYLVAASTGRSAASKVLESDPSIPCPDDANDSGGCIVERVSMKNLSGKPFDDILRMSYLRQEELNYPRDLVDVKLSDKPGSEAFVSQASFYQSGDELEWIILVISPVQRSSTDALTASEGLFGVVCVVGATGFVLCLAMFLSFLFKRRSRAVILADWRFTSAFLLGCALMNLSTFTFLGENTEALCLARMWVFHFVFALALSPLFVKVYRMHRLVGTPNRQPAMISNPHAVALTLPVVLIQVIILTAFTIIDPPQPEDAILIEETVVTQKVQCSTDSRAFTYTVIGFEAGLVLIGCVLAFLTRNLDPQFGEAKQLMFSMYNIAFIGVVIAVISFAMDIDYSGQIILFSLGIFCGTVFSSAAFVLPRLIQSRGDRVVLPSGRRNSNASKVNVNKSTKNKKFSRVSFNENVEEVARSPTRKFTEEESRERAVTGWSAVDDEGDAATGLKRASSINSMQEDDVWTQYTGNNPGDHNIPDHESTEPTAWDDTWFSSNQPETDAPETAPSHPSSASFASSSLLTSDPSSKRSSKRSKVPWDELSC